MIVVLKLQRPGGKAESAHYLAAEPANRCAPRSASIRPFWGWLAIQAGLICPFWKVWISSIPSSAFPTRSNAATVSSTQMIPWFRSGMQNSAAGICDDRGGRARSNRRSRSYTLQRPSRLRARSCCAAARSSRARLRMTSKGCTARASACLRLPSRRRAAHRDRTDEH